MSQSTRVATPVDAATLRSWRSDLLTITATGDAERWDQLRALEELKAAAAAMQARIAVAFDESSRDAQEAAGARPRDVGAGVAAQVALARRESPTRGARHLGLAHALVDEMPQTWRALSLGETSEWRATVIARETACLTRADRSAVDRELARRPGGLAAMGDRAVLVESRRIAYRLDAASFTRRAAKAESERRVSLRPAPDTMTLLSGLLPVRQGVAVLAALTRRADSLRCEGDTRSRGQIMADTLVERLTGQAVADDVPLEVRLVMTDHALMSQADDREVPAEVEGYGPVPAALARSWVRGSAAEVWLRRLYADPVAGTLVAMDSRRRTFTGQLRELVVARDQVCRTPWCDAPVRHVDHPRRAVDGGPTSLDNAQGLCEACNHAKEAPGWWARSVAGEVQTWIPTGHRFVSRPPPVVARPRPPLPRLDRFVRDLLLTG